MRIAAGLRQVDLAEKMGVTQGTICDWEVGRTMPQAALLPALADALNCTIDALFGRGEGS